MKFNQHILAALLIFLNSIVLSQNTFNTTISLGWSSAGINIIEVEDGFIITGVIRNSSDYLHLTKCDLQGKYSWHKVYGRKVWHLPHCISKLPDSNYIILANLWDTLSVESNYTNWILKVNNEGDTIWTKELAGRLLDMDIAPDGGFIFTGYALLDPIGYPQRTAIYCVRTDSLVNIIWQDTIEFEDYDKGLSVVANPDTTFTVLGHLVEHGTGKAPATVIKLDKSGSIIWKREYPYVTPYFNLNSIIRDKNSYVFTAQNYTAVVDKKDAFVVKIDSIGDTIWVKRFGENNQIAEYIFSISVTANSNYIFTGSKYDDVWLVRIDSSGNILFDTTFRVGIYSQGNDIIETSDGGICITGSANMGNGVNSIVLIKTNAQGKITGIREYKSDHLIDIYPNPTISSFTVELNLKKPAEINLEMTDMLSRRVLSKNVGTQAAGSAKFQLETGHLPAGIYLLKATIGAETVSRKVVVE